MNNSVPLVLHRDQNLSYASNDNKAEGLRNSPSGKSIKFKHDQHTIIPGTKNVARFPRQPKVFIPHPELHSKTYFNALERILMAPDIKTANFNEYDPSTWPRKKIFEYSMNRPPKNISD